MDSDVVLFVKRDLVRPRKGSAVVSPTAREVRYARMTLPELPGRSWWSALREAGWDTSLHSVYACLGSTDEVPREHVEGFLRDVSSRVDDGVLLFHTSRMMDEERRLRDWLGSLGFDDVRVQRLSDDAVHGGSLYPSDGGMRDRWLVRCDIVPRETS